MEAMGKRLYIRNLPFSLEEEALESALREVLAEFGDVVNLVLVFEGSTLRPKGLCFAEMGSDEEVHLAVHHLHGLNVAGRTVEVGEARPRLCVPEHSAATRRRGSSSRKTGGKGKSGNA